MKKKIKTDLSVRELTTKDANSYYSISKGASLHRYANFFEANTLKAAQQRIEAACNNPYEKMYGLFAKTRLVSVYLVVQEACDDADDDGAIVHCFVGEKYYGNNLASRGICLLTELLNGVYSHFHFEIENSNEASLHIPSKLGAEEVEPHGVYRQFVFSF